MAWYERSTAFDDSQRFGCIGQPCSGLQYWSRRVNGLTVQLMLITSYPDLSQHQSHQGLYGNRKNSDLIEP